MRSAMLVATIVALSSLVDVRASVVAVPLAVLALASAAWGPDRRAPESAEIVRVLAGCLVLAGVVAGAIGAPAVTAIAAAVVAVALLTWTLATEPPVRRMVAATAAATAGSVVLAAAAAVLSRLPEDPTDVLALLAAATLAAVAATRWRHVDGGDPDRRGTAAVGACATASAGLLLPVVVPGWSLATPVAVGLVAAGLVLLAATVGQPGRHLATVGTPRRARRRDADDGGLRGLAALVLACPVLVLALASTRGALPPTTWAVLLPSVPAALHLAVVSARRRDRAAAATRDALTGLPTEPVFAGRLADALQQARASGGAVVVAFLDLDGFKAVNDRHGHDAGDTVLIEAARRLTEGLRDGDLVARRSGDEFLVLLPDVADRDRAEQVAHRLAAAVAVPIPSGDAHLEVRASIGLALWPEDAGSAAELLAAADAAMYDAKAAGASEAVRWCSAAATARSRVAGRLRRDLEAAVAAIGGIEVELEEVVDARTGARTGHVATPRWCHPTLGVLQPDTYLPLLIDPVVARRYDDAVLDEALRLAPHDLDLTVPCTAVTLQDEAWPARLAARLATDGRPARSLRVAVTASAVRRSGDATLRAVTRLADLGVGCELTDLGDGREVALRDLAALPLVGIELAAPLVTVGRRHTDRALVAALVAVAAAWQVPVRAPDVTDDAVRCELTLAGVTSLRRTASDVAPSWASPRGRAADLDATARALLEGRGEVTGAALDEVLARVLAAELVTG